MKRRLYLPTTQLFTSSAAQSSSSRHADGGDSSDEERVIYAEHDSDVYLATTTAVKKPEKPDVSRSDMTDKPILKRPKFKRPLTELEMNGPAVDDNTCYLSSCANNTAPTVSFRAPVENQYTSVDAAAVYAKRPIDLLIQKSGEDAPSTLSALTSRAESARPKSKTIQEIMKAERPAHWGKPKAPKRAQAPLKSSAARPAQTPRAQTRWETTAHSLTAPDGSLLPLSFKPSWLPSSKVAPKVKTENIIDDAVKFAPDEHPGDEWVSAYADIRTAASPSGVNSVLKSSPPSSSPMRKPSGRHGPLVSRLHKLAQAARNDEERLASLKRREAAAGACSDDDGDDTLARLQDPRRRALVWVDVTILADAPEGKFAPFRACRVTVDAVTPNREAIDPILRRRSVYCDLVADGASPAPAAPRSDEEYVERACRVVYMAAAALRRHRGGQELVALFDLPPSAATPQGRLRLSDPACLDLYGSTVIVCTSLFESI